MTEDEMVRWHHQLNGYESKLLEIACCDSWGHKELALLSN